MKIEQGREKEVTFEELTPIERDLDAKKGGISVWGLNIEDSFIANGEVKQSLWINLCTTFGKKKKEDKKKRKSWGWSSWLRNCKLKIEQEEDEDEDEEEEEEETEAQRDFLAIRV